MTFLTHRSSASLALPLAHEPEPSHHAPSGPYHAKKERRSRWSTAARQCCVAHRRIRFALASFALLLMMVLYTAWHRIDAHEPHEAVSPFPSALFPCAGEAGSIEACLGLQLAWAAEAGDCLDDDCAFPDPFGYPAQLSDGRMHDRLFPSNDGLDGPAAPTQGRPGWSIGSTPRTGSSTVPRSWPPEPVSPAMAADGHYEDAVKSATTALRQAVAGTSRLATEPPEGGFALAPAPARAAPPLVLVGITSFPSHVVRRSIIREAYHLSRPRDVSLRFLLCAPAVSADAETTVISAMPPMTPPPTSEADALRYESLAHGDLVLLDCERDGGLLQAFWRAGPAQKLPLTPLVMKATDTTFIDFRALSLFVADRVAPHPHQAMRDSPYPVPDAWPRVDDSDSDATPAREHADADADDHLRPSVPMPRPRGMEILFNHDQGHDVYIVSRDVVNALVTAWTTRGPAVVFSLAEEEAWVADWMRSAPVVRHRVLAPGALHAAMADRLSAPAEASVANDLAPPAGRPTEHPTEYPVEHPAEDLHRGLDYESGQAAHPPSAGDHDRDHESGYDHELDPEHDDHASEHDHHRAGGAKDHEDGEPIVILGVADNDAFLRWTARPRGNLGATAAVPQNWSATWEEASLSGTAIGRRTPRRMMDHAGIATI
ncbi:hypothetical protein CXG81DRAFT_20640 [Caulochytrium protostelioides]|uniref:Uncharacterized protein n=1 Tax=Caulochytrium protostelioides TaxID=1555241 RepID=A0A4V1IU43_9FUNG|nr:hypothetical protein CXG81DRAFT_20640 [Caulochytrium protostelioides]|eukprot:RKO99257.1 hypothetical protein CXG81DRAFT_20640 [Caulochytrium protostelioides]